MWLFRGAQSAVFFYMTCTPCAEHVDRKRRKRSAARGFRDPIPLTEDGAATDQQPVFHQPFPFSTNIYWEEEITLGPGPPARRKNGKANNQRSLDKHKQQQRLRYEMNQPSDYSAQSKHSKGKAKQSQETTENASQDNGGQSQNDRWNWKRYQREDEVLWGKEMKQKRSKGKHAAGDDHDDDDNDEMGPTYFIARNPEVNDLHPPVVSGPKTRSDTRWMLQPPPCADVMAGKVRCDQEDSGRMSRQIDAVYLAPGTPTPELPPAQETTTANNNAPKPSPARPQTSSSRYEDAVIPPPVTPQPAPKSSRSNRQQLTLDIPSSDEDFSDADDATFSAATLSPIEGSPRSPHPQFQSLVGSPRDEEQRHQSFFDHFESFDSFNARSNAPVPRLNSAVSPTSAHSNTYTNPYASFFAQTMLKSLHAHKTSSGSTEERKLTADSGKAFPAMAPSKDHFPPLTGATATNQTSEAGATNHNNEEDFGGFQLHYGHMSSQKTVAENDLLTTPKQVGPLNVHIEDTARQLRWSMDI
ncbi:pheromone processing endoprotease [Ascosphaera pollenicola]|nr:pheromone processing endoprotease [Ascosphaera pollenicola]